jgi:hypothetical protein
MGDHCRHNVGSWPVEQIYADNQLKDFAYYATKDEKKEFSLLVPASSEDLNFELFAFPEK